jgi:excisionase family DNA binding protein
MFEEDGLQPEICDNLMTYPEAAEYLGMKVNTCYQLVHQGRLPHIRFSARMVRFERRALERFIAKHRVAPKRR